MVGRFICASGKERLASVHVEARMAETEEEAYCLVQEAARIRYGLPLDSLDPVVSEALKEYHGIQWRAHKWSGRIVRNTGIEIDGDLSRFFRRTIDLIYRGPEKKNDRDLRHLGFDRNF